MDRKKILKKTAAYVRALLSGAAESGHDWWHTKRVWNNARLLQKTEGGDLFVIELAALLHDIADYKFHGGDQELGPRLAFDWLTSLDVEPAIAKQVSGIIRNMNYKGSAGEEEAFSLEHAVVQDADRLDAMGAIGIARCFSFGGHFGREIYNPNSIPKQNMTKKEYQSSKSNSINHFYEKLLFLRDKMLTQTGKALAETRHSFMQEYLREFFKEVEPYDQQVDSDLRLLTGNE